MLTPYILTASLFRMLDSMQQFDIIYSMTQGGPGDTLTVFQVQAYQFANYHVTDATAFYQKRDFWQISPDPTQSASTVSGSLPPMRPYYQLIKVPGSDTEQFQLVIPFVPNGRQNMVAWMAASSDPVNYGHITDFQFPEGRNIEGPQQVFARINNDPQPRREVPQAAVEGAVPRHLLVPHEQRARGSVDGHRAAHSGAVPARIEDAHLEDGLRRRHVGIPAQPDVERQTIVHFPVIVGIKGQIPPQSR